MLDVNHLKLKIPNRFSVPNMVLLAGAGQNVGKTSFAVALISHFKKLGFIVYGLKITPHFHEMKPENLLIQKDDFQISLEKNRSRDKDTSRLLNAGAEEVFFIQSKEDTALPIAFDFVNRITKENVLWVCESGGLRSYVDPGLFLYFKLKGTKPEKPSAKKWMPLADKIVEFDGANFSLTPEQIGIDNDRFHLI